MRDSGRRLIRLVAIVFAASLLWACEGDDGADGAAGPTGPQGPPGQAGPPGPPIDTAIQIGDGSLLTAEEIAELGKLVAEITSVTVSSAPVVEFTVADKNGNPAVGLANGTVRGTFAKLVPGDPDFNGGLPYWQNYINRVSTSDPGGLLPSAIQATNDREGLLEDLGGGQYRFTFSVDVTNVTEPIPVVWEPSLTHRVALEIRLDRDNGSRRAMAPDNPFKDFTPDGGAGSGVTKLIAKTDNCEGCHYEFAEHGGARKVVEYCVTCHNPGSVDPNSGESVDMAYLAHSIHMGDDRGDGEIPYIVDGDNFGEVHFPQSKTYCETCHAASESHPDGDNWNETASAKTCGGCHAEGLVTGDFDAVTGQTTYQFDHGAAVADGGFSAVANDGSCIGCHLGVVDTAGPPLSIHSRIRGDDRFRAALGENFIFEVISATDTAPGQTPVITFKVSNKDGEAYDLLTDPEFTDSNATLNLYVAWTTDDIYNGDELGATQSLGYTDTDDDGIPDIGPQLRRGREIPAQPHRMALDALQYEIAVGGDAVRNADGSYTVTYFAPVPAAVTGDVMISIGGHPAAIGFENAEGETPAERAAATSVTYFPGTPRQVAVGNENCNSCHKRLQFHGDNRNGNVVMCLNCHNADLADNEDAFAFGYMIHSIHSGSTTFQGGRYDHVHFPQSIANCVACHVNEANGEPAYDIARMTARAVSVSLGVDVYNWLDDFATTPNAAYCGACHNDVPSMSHFASMGAQNVTPKDEILTVNGQPTGQESCAVCHAEGSEFATTRYHNPGL